MHVYEKLDGMSTWLLGFIALRELLRTQLRPSYGEGFLGAPLQPGARRAY